VTAPFEIAGGTVVGRDHVLSGRNNQDAFCWSSDGGTAVAVVADGCGSGRYSEVGAQVGARLLAEALRARAACFDDEPAAVVLARVRLDVLARLRTLAAAMGGRLSAVVSDYFLFTTLGFVATPAATVVFGIGDGVVAVNGAVRRLTAPDNTPAYLGYALTASDFDEDALGFVVYERRPADETETLLAGTDGAGDLPDLADFWAQDRYFANPFVVGRRLRQLGTPRGVPKMAGLPDDTTLIVARRARA
jgi:hypothetical protein